MEDERKDKDKDSWGKRSNCCGKWQRSD